MCICVYIYIDGKMYHPHLKVEKIQFSQALIPRSWAATAPLPPSVLVRGKPFKTMKKSGKNRGSAHPKK